ncbi:hypothetical protein [Streptomyces xanthochromogenes]|uniref:hypothetical protein n=1 Tax=Streptomyces xanthochromogenes TaxID=67384 RepID=UPI00342D1E1D
MGVMPHALRAVAAAGLAIDGYVHLELADRYSYVASFIISEGVLFRAEAAAAILAALLVLFRRRRAGDTFAWLTAAAGLTALILYRYLDPGSLGPLPDMYEPIWFASKVWSLIGQAAAILALTPLIAARPRPRGGGTARTG